MDQVLALGLNPPLMGGASSSSRCLAGDRHCPRDGRALEVDLMCQWVWSEGFFWKARVKATTPTRYEGPCTLKV